MTFLGFVRAGPASFQKPPFLSAERPGYLNKDSIVAGFPAFKVRPVAKSLPLKVLPSDHRTISSFISSVLFVHGVSEKKFPITRTTTLSSKTNVR